MSEQRPTLVERLRNHERGSLLRLLAADRIEELEREVAALKEKRDKTVRIIQDWGWLIDKAANYQNLKQSDVDGFRADLKKVGE